MPKSPIRCKGQRIRDGAETLASAGKVPGNHCSADLPTALKIW
jgi:hypothetical protein